MNSELTLRVHFPQRFLPPIAEFASDEIHRFGETRQSGNQRERERGDSRDASSMICRLVSV
ncbi:MAG: hypothetical protein NT023_17755 [Armatimonadetes bacterium]|nr:hypothetical protein [Armatimonadota bacterium]